MRRQRVQRVTRGGRRRRGPAAPETREGAAGFATAASIASSALLASLCAFYWYGLIRTLAIFPGPLEYVGLVAVSVGLMSAPSVALLAGAQIVLNRHVAVGRHLAILALAVVFGVIACEGLVLANDASLTRSQPAATGWQYRWFPFSFRKVGYNQGSGEHFVEF